MPEAMVAMRGVWVRLLIWARPLKSRPSWAIAQITLGMGNMEPSRLEGWGERVKGRGQRGEQETGGRESVRERRRGSEREKHAPCRWCHTVRRGGHRTWSGLINQHFSMHPHLQRIHSRVKEWFSCCSLLCVFVISCLVRAWRCVGCVENFPFIIDSQILT